MATVGHMDQSLPIFGTLFLPGAPTLPHRDAHPTLCQERKENAGAAGRLSRRLPDLAVGPLTWWAPLSFRPPSPTVAHLAAAQG